MKKITLSSLVFLVLLCGLFLIQACKNCDGVACAAAPASVYLEIRDAQNNNLLDPQVTGHYDTTQIKLLNGNLFKVVPQSRSYTKNVGLLLYPSIGQTDYVLKLSAADQGTLSVQMEQVTKKCCSSSVIKQVLYNGKATETFAGGYTVRKN